MFKRFQDCLTFSTEWHITAKYCIYSWRDIDTTHLCTCPVCCHSCCDQDDMHRCNFPVCLCSCPPTLSRRCLGLCRTRLCLKETERKRDIIKKRKKKSHVPAHLSLQHHTRHR